MAPLDLGMRRRCPSEPCLEDASVDAASVDGPSDIDAASCTCETGVCIGGRCCESVCGEICLPTRFETQRLEVGREPRWTFLEDVDADGRDDLVVPIQLDSRVEIAWGVATGDPPTVTTVIPMGRVLAGTTVMDFDHDGLMDIVSVVEAAPSVLRVARALGNRRFEPLVEIEQPGSPLWMTAIDVDRDRWDDLAIRLVDDDCVAVRRRTAEGLDPQNCVIPYASPDSFERLAAGDADGDGTNELFELRGSRTGRVLHRHVFGPDASLARSDVLAGPLGREPTSFDLPDVDRDGTVELVMFSGNGPDTLAAIRAPSGAECELPTSFAVSDSLDEEVVTAAGDFDGDGVLDLAGFTTCGLCSGAVYLHLGRIE